MPEMPSKKVDTITSNEDAVRLEIYEGRLPIDQAQAELHRMEVAQLKAEIARLQDRRSWPDLDAAVTELEKDAAPKANACPHCGKEIESE